VLARGAMSGHPEEDFETQTLHDAKIQKYHEDCRSMDHLNYRENGSRSFDACFYHVLAPNSSERRFNRVLSNSLTQPTTSDKGTL